MCFIKRNTYYSLPKLSDDVALVSVKGTYGACRSILEIYS